MDADECFSPTLKNNKVLATFHADGSVIVDRDSPIYEEINRFIVDKCNELRRAEGLEEHIYDWQKKEL